MPMSKRTKGFINFCAGVLLCCALNSLPLSLFGIRDWVPLIQSYMRGLIAITILRFGDSFGTDVLLGVPLGIADAPGKKRC